MVEGEISHSRATIGEHQASALGDMDGGIVGAQVQTGTVVFTQLGCSRAVEPDSLICGDKLL